MDVGVDFLCFDSIVEFADSVQGLKIYTMVFTEGAYGGVILLIFDFF